MKLDFLSFKIDCGDSQLTTMSPCKAFALDTPSDIEKDKNPLQIFIDDRSAGPVRVRTGLL